ncbi:hypothetical protein [Jeotgalicoccus sp. WY2]|nr:hypothetical protein [Jeotgalicoccus sp. WY2]
MKLENHQKTGAFKYRGASYKLSKLTPAQLAAGVVTHLLATMHRVSL